MNQYKKEENGIMHPLDQEIPDHDEKLPEFDEIGTALNDI